MPANLDTVLSAGRLFDAQDWTGLTELLHPGVVTYWPEDWPESGVFAGREMVIGHFRRLRGAWTGSQLTAETAAEYGDWVTVRWRQSVEPRGRAIEGAPSEEPEGLDLSAAYRIAEGQIMEIRFHWDHAEAVAATEG